MRVFAACTHAATTRAGHAQIPNLTALVTWTMNDHAHLAIFRQLPLSALINWWYGIINNLILPAPLQ